MNAPESKQAAEAPMGGKILVADDDPAIVTLLTKRLSHHGYEVRSVRDGTSALQAVEAEPTDMVLLDIMMPGLDGYEVLRRLRHGHSLVELPIIMISAKGQGDDVVRALHLGANDFAIKPIDFNLLLQRVKRHMALRAPKEQVIGPYRILGKIGEGGMGIVFEARHVTDDRPAALKVLPRSMTIDEKFVSRFRQEAALAQRVDHPNVVKFLDAGVDGETHYLALELVEGTDLAALRERRRIAPAEIVEIGLQVARGLDALTERGVLHRDVKPENVILTSDGVAKLTDFGIARDARKATRLTDTGTGIGSVVYASPEQLEGEGDSRADIYSLGCTLFFLLTGNDPFPQDKPVEWVYREKKRRPPRVGSSVRKGVPPDLISLIEAMMSPVARRRPASLKAVVRALETIGRGESYRPLRWEPLMYLVGGALTAAAFAAWYFTR